MSRADEPEHRTPKPSGEPEREERFLRRWSRRKQEARAPETTAGHDQPPAEPPKAPEKVLSDADMPPLESLDEKSDFSLFMSPGVSEELRRRALRKLFMLPAINQRCPLDGEWYDCHGFEPLGDIITHDMREEMKRAALKLKESAEEVLREDEQAAAAASADALEPAPTNNAGDPASAPAGADATNEIEAKPLRGHMRKRGVRKENKA